MDFIILKQRGDVPTEMVFQQDGAPQSRELRSVADQQRSHKKHKTDGLWFQPVEDTDKEGRARLKILVSLKLPDDRDHFRSGCKIDHTRGGSVKNAPHPPYVNQGSLKVRQNSVPAWALASLEAPIGP